MIRATVLNEAFDAVCNDRQGRYGAPEDCFRRIGDLWAVYLGRSVSELDVANMMVLFKMGRAMSGKPHLDNYIDMAGYAACAGEIEHNSREPKEGENEDC